MNNINYIGGDELVFNTDEELGIHSGGFSVNSIMMKYGMSPIMTLNDQYGGSSDKVSDLFNNLVIPNWTLSYGNKMGGSTYNDINDDINNEDESDDDIDDDLHDKLIELARDHENNGVKKGGKKKKTQKLKQITKKRGTKKYK
jgi:hypothetical protein